MTASLEGNGLDRLLTTSEVAEICRTVPGTVRYWRHAGIGPKGFRLARRVVYPEPEVRRWLAERRAAEQGA
jgi:predicted DNA-binding transcriptional regulator AlpA